VILGAPRGRDRHNIPSNSQRVGLEPQGNRQVEFGFGFVIFRLVTPGPKSDLHALGKFALTLRTYAPEVGSVCGPRGSFG
jgi:hypothetical protein